MHMNPIGWPCQAVRRDPPRIELEERAFPFRTLFLVPAARSRAIPVFRGWNVPEAVMTSRSRLAAAMEWPLTALRSHSLEILASLLGTHCCCILASMRGQIRRPGGHHPPEPGDVSDRPQAEAQLTPPTMSTSESISSQRTFSPAKTPSHIR